MVRSGGAIYLAIQMKEKADLRSHLLAIQITEKVLLFLTRHIVFLEYESNQGEHGGSRN
jgi:hypothetical protein